MANFRLKSLELNGYKTFASRTRFEFSGSITVIVGPNGSGKSNIADSIRWVLGEQAISVLRGRKSEDMIFSGSEKRPRAGMASATVTFDNHDGWLPIDFSEVSITRRTFRDGQNEYLINQQKVRLRDVNELLSQSSLAERTYTVIGQGLVDTALTLNSDDRRRLFEEAAGIGLYRNRKDQSKRRLIETRRNLDRVADIMAELKPRLRNLERQAKRSEEHGVLRADLRENLRSWYGYQWHRSQDKLLNLREIAESHEEDLGLSREKQNELTRELSQLRLTAQELRINLNNLHRNLAELHASREKSGRELAVSTERQRALKEQRQAMQAESQRLTTELASLQSRMQENKKEKIRIEEEIVDSKGHVDEARKLLSGQLTEQESNIASSRKLIDSLSGFRAQIIASQSKQEELVQTQAKFAQENVELENALSDLIDRKNELSTESENNQSELEKLEEREVHLENELEALLDRQKNMQSQLSSDQEKIADLIQEKANVNANIQALIASEANLEGFVKGAEKLFALAKSKKIRVHPKTIGKAIKVDSKLERAISNALGDYLDAVILTGKNDLAKTLNLLDGQDQSLAILRSDINLKKTEAKMPTGEGILGRASKLVSIDMEFQAGMQTILSNILIVEDSKIALALLNSKNIDYQIVTLKGEHFSAEGHVTLRSSASASSISRPRKIKKLGNDLNSLEEKIIQLQSQIDSANNEMIKLDQSLLLERASIEKENILRENVRRRKQSTLLEDEQIDRQIEWFSSQQRNGKRDTELAKKDLLDLKVTINEIEKNLQSSQIKVDEAEPVSELPLDDHRAQVAHWEMRAAVSQRALQENERREREFDLLIKNSNEQLTNLDQRKEQLNKFETELGQEQDHLNSLEGGSGEEIAGIQSQINPAEEDLSRTDSELRMAQEAEGIAILRLTTAERNHTQAQISLARQQEALSTLRGRIEDDFGLVAFEYDDAVSGPTPLPLGDLVEKLPILESVDDDLEDRLKQQRVQIRRLGSINPEAQSEYQSVKDRFADMKEQVADLEAAEVNLKEVISELDLLMDREFRKTFETVAAEFRNIFSRLFSGGSAHLILTDENDLTNTGIDIEARLPGKRSQRLALLSGGERSLTAAALIFSLLKASPTPFCVMDEVDAMLDEANVGRFTELLKELSENTQFVLITHNRNTVQVAEVIYGITMGRDTTSQVISLKLDEVDERYSES